MVFPKSDLTFVAAELGSSNVNSRIGCLYMHGENGLERDVTKAKHFWEKAAIGGDVVGRNNAGTVEYYAGNIERAKKHYMITASAGLDISLKFLKKMYLDGLVSKDELAQVLRDNQRNKDEVRRDMTGHVSKLFRF